MKNLILILTLTFLASCNPKTHTLKVDRVIDGDSFISNNQRYRISEIDAPELSQTYGIESKNYLTNLILCKYVKIEVVGTDKYDREIVKVFVDGTPVSNLMVRSGNSWVYRRYNKSSLLLDLEQEARDKKLGLWKYEASINPYEFRKQHKK